MPTPSVEPTSARVSSPGSRNKPLKPPSVAELIGVAPIAGNARGTVATASLPASMLTPARA